MRSMRKNGVPSTSPVGSNSADLRHRHVGPLADDPHRVVLVLERVVHEDREVLGGDGATRATYSPVRGSPSSVQVASKTSVSEDMPLASMPLCSVTFGSRARRQRTGQPALEQCRDGGWIAAGALELQVGRWPLGHEPSLV